MTCRRFLRETSRRLNSVTAMKPRRMTITLKLTKTATLLACKVFPGIRHINLTFPSNSGYNIAMMGSAMIPNITVKRISVSEQERSVDFNDFACADRYIREQAKLLVERDEVRQVRVVVLFDDL